MAARFEQWRTVSGKLSGVMPMLVGNILHVTTAMFAPGLSAGGNHGTSFKCRQMNPERASTSKGEKCDRGTPWNCRLASFSAFVAVMEKC